MKSLMAAAVLLALSAVALAKPTPIERPRLALVNADTDMGSVVAMQENIGSIRAMRERDYFAAPQLPLNNFPCRLEPVPQDAPGSITPVAYHILDHERPSMTYITL